MKISPFTRSAKLETIEILLGIKMEPKGLHGMTHTIDSSIHL